MPLVILVFQISFKGQSRAVGVKFISHAMFSHLSFGVCKQEQEGERGVGGHGTEALAWLGGLLAV